MIEILRELVDRCRLKALADDASLCGFDSKDIKEAPVVELEPE